MICHPVHALDAVTARQNRRKGNPLIKAALIVAAGAFAFIAAHSPEMMGVVFGLCAVRFVESVVVE